MKDAKSLLLMLGAVILVLFGLTIFIKKTPTSIPKTNQKSLTIGNTTVIVTVANTNETRQKGLSGITNLQNNQGMLFIFDTKNIPVENAKFWMKDMKIPLDFIWIKDNKISEITPNVPAPIPNTPDNALQIYAPSTSIDYVLEVNAGFTMKNNIKVGDTVTNL